MTKRIVVFVVLLCALIVLTGPAWAEERIKMATTTSTENSGLLGVLIPPFEKKFGYNVDVIAVGTGAALKLGENGDVDVVLVHAPEREEEFIQTGYGVNRRRVMYNDFIIVGPGDDPAGIRGEKDAARAMALIAGKKSPFISRGDDSGTHIKEQFLWKESGVPLEEVKKLIPKKDTESTVQYVAPPGDWYFSIGQGMGAALMMADEKRAYCVADRGTYLAYRDKIKLNVLTEGDPRLYNPYGVIAVNPERFPRLQYFGAMALIAWMTSVEGQKIIADFRQEGEVLFHPLAVRPDSLGKR